MSHYFFFFPSMLLSKDNYALVSNCAVWFVHPVVPRKERQMGVGLWVCIRVQADGGGQELAKVAILQYQGFMCEVSSQTIHYRLPDE